MKYHLLLLLLLAIGCSSKKVTIKEVSWRGWQGCYQMSNKKCEVIIAPTCGGRVLWFSLDGDNIIYEDPSQDGKLFEEWISDPFNPDGGRFDYGPERTTQSLHAKTWIGKWNAGIIDDQVLRLTSKDDTVLGLKSIREFRLHADSAILYINQKATNIGSLPITRHFWGRTLVKPGGTILLPMNAKSQFENKWGQFLWDPDLIVSPKGLDKRLQMNSDTLCFHAIGATIKAGTDATDGWISYLLGKLVFDNRFQVFGEEDYSGSDNMTGIFFSNGEFAEIEPCSPTYSIPPDSSIVFTERWELSEVSK